MAGINHGRHYRGAQLTGSFLLFAGLGLMIALTAQVAVPGIPVETEQGTLAASAGVVRDSGASGGSAVKFAAPTPKPTPTHTPANASVRSVLRPADR